MPALHCEKSLLLTPAGQSARLEQKDLLPCDLFLGLVKGLGVRAPVSVSGPGIPSSPRGKQLGSYSEVLGSFFA